MRPLTKNETLVFKELRKRNEARVKSISNACDISIDHTEGFETLRQIQRNLTSGVQVRSQYRNLSRKDMKVTDFSKTQLLDLFEITQALIKIKNYRRFSVRETPIIETFTIFSEILVFRQERLL